MELKDFNTLTIRDFENGAVIDEIYRVFKERDKLRNQKDQLGIIYADNVEDWGSRNSIQVGFYRGEKVIGEIVDMAQKLEIAAYKNGYYKDSTNYYNKLQQCRLNFYDVMKKLENLFK